MNILQRMITSIPFLEEELLASSRRLVNVALDRGRREITSAVRVNGHHVERSAVEPPRHDRLSQPGLATGCDQDLQADEQLGR